MNAISGLYRSGLSPPIESIIACEFLATRQSETFVFQAFSAGKTFSSARIASASGVLNSTAFVIFIFSGAVSTACAVVPPTSNERTQSPRRYAPRDDPLMKRTGRQVTTNLIRRPHPVQHARQCAREI